MLENLSTTTRAPNARRESSLRQTVYHVLEKSDGDDTASQVVDVCLIALIFASVISVILESIADIEGNYGDAFYWFEVFTISVFSIEYLLRIWSCVEGETNTARNAITTRFRYIFSFNATIDLLAILPFYLLIFGLFGGLDMRFLRAVRLLRILKLTRYFTALNLLIITLKDNSRSLAAAFLILLTVMLFAASGMYYFERQSQPVDFGSIPAAMWWAFATLTTVGYGDVTPITVGGKVFGALITVVGVGMVALPTSILASGFSQQFQRDAQQYRKLADEALDDGVLEAEEVRELEELRLNLGMGKNTASQILNEGMVQAALSRTNERATCPHCKREL